MCYKAFVAEFFYVNVLLSGIFPRKCTTKQNYLRKCATKWNFLRKCATKQFFLRKCTTKRYFST